MTNGNSDRLDRIERTLERLAERDEILAIRLERLTLGLEETKAIANSNSRTIQGMLERSESERLQREEEKAQQEKRMEFLEGLVTRLVSLEEGQNRMLANLDENQPTVLRKLNVIETKVDQLLDRTEQ